MPENDAAGGDPRSYAIIGAAMEVHRVLGAGFLESVYRQALAIEFDLRGIAFVPEMAMSVVYKDHSLAAGFRADFLCYGTVIVEIKALARLTGVDEAQTINYLRASRNRLGLLLNFGAARLDYRRFVV
jgi:GxxExxY protein